jgi:hypothetical protein
LFPKDFDAYGDVLQPTNVLTANNANGTNRSTTNLADNKDQAKIFSNDLDSSLASLADNLAINKNKNFGG